MATTPPNTTPAGQPAAVTWLLRNRRPAAYALLVIGALALVGCVYLFARESARLKFAVEERGAALSTTLGASETTPATTQNQYPGYLIAWGLGLVGLCCLAAGALPLVGKEVFDRPDVLRWQVLLFGGVVGLILALLGLALGYFYFADLVAWVQKGERDNAWKPLLALLVLLAGLGVAFATLQGFRTEERENATMRRLLYGYNAFLAVFLLLLVLVVANVAVAAYYSDQTGSDVKGMIDLTGGGFYSLSDQTTRVLESLDRPAKVYLIMTSGSREYEDLDFLLRRAQTVTDKLRVEYISPDTGTEYVRKLRNQYKGVRIGEGLLVTYGDNFEQASFIPVSDLFGTQGRTMTFQAEDKLVNALLELSQGGKKAVVYVSQGFGEPELTNSDPRADGLGVLQQRLGKRAGLTVKPLAWDPAKPEVPNDAAILMIVNPKGPYPPPVVAAIERFLEPPTPEQRKARQDAAGVEKGKLLAFLGATPNPVDRKKMITTGLEAVLGRYNVTPTDSRLLMIVGQVPTSVGRMPRSPEETLATLWEQAADSNNPLVRIIADNPFVWDDCRLLQAGGASPQARAEPLLGTMRGYITWEETDLATSPADLQDELARAFQSERRDYITARKPTRAAQPLMVVVSEAGAPASPFQPAPAAGKPRLAVFASASPVLNPSVGERGSGLNFNLVASTIDWLREKPESIGIPAKPYNTFALTEKVDYYRLAYLPLLALLLSVVGLGASVWVVRRR